MKNENLISNSTHLPRGLRFRFFIILFRFSFGGTRPRQFMAHLQWFMDATNIENKIKNMYGKYVFVYCAEV